VHLGGHVLEVGIGEGLLRVESRETGEEVELEEVLRPRGRAGLEVVEVVLLDAGENDGPKSKRTRSGPSSMRILLPPISRTPPRNRTVGPLMGGEKGAWD